MPPDAEDSRTQRGMSPLQRVAMGLVLTVVDPVVAGYDAVPDLLGWVLVVAGLRPLRHRSGMAGPVAAALIAGLVSIALVRPRLIMELPESTGWWLSLPQIAFSFFLCGAVAAMLPGHDPLAGRFFRLRRTFVVVGAGPVLLYGGGVDALLVPLAVLTVLANVYLIYLVFRAVPAVDGTARLSRP